MQYTDLETLKTQISEELLLQIASDGLGGIDTNLLDEINKRTVAEVEGHLRGIYVLPLAADLQDVDPQITEIVNYIMQFGLYSRIDGADVPETVESTYNAQIKRLEKIAARTVTLAHDKVDVDDDTPATFRSITPDAKFPAGFTKM